MILVRRDPLGESGLLLRYRMETSLDGLKPGEHPFLACSFGLVEQYARTAARPRRKANGPTRRVLERTGPAQRRI